MKTTIFRRMLALCLVLCPLPACGLAFNGDESPVTRSDFDFRLHVNPDAFPNDGKAHYQDWADLLRKISVKGRVDSQHAFQFENRVYMDAGLYLNDELKIPFDYDSYVTYRYMSSPALDGSFVHFHMDNFFQFMFKGYYFMGLPTQLIGLLMYPEAAEELFGRYASLIAPVVEGEGSRTVEYDTLYELCQELNLIVQEDYDERTYYWFSCLLFDLGLSDMLLERLGYLEDWLDYLDPDGMGLTITEEDGVENWVLGETEIFTRTEDGFNFWMPDYEGYEYGVTMNRDGEQVTASIGMMMDGADYLTLTIEADGVPAEDAMEAEMAVTFAVTGDALYEAVEPVTLTLSYARDAEVLPYNKTLTVNWVHPETGKPAIGFTYEAASEAVDASVFEEKIYILRQDFFTLNESFLAEYKERFLPTLALGAMPFVMEVPSGVISDLYTFMYETGILAFLGIE